MTVTYASAVDWCWSTRWAECKDRDRSRARALACFQPSAPTPDVFAVGAAYALRDRLKGLGLSPATVNRHLAAYLAVWGSMASRMPSLGGPPSGLYLREPAGRSRVVTRTELDRLVRELGHPYGALVRFLAETGCRVSEALKLRPGDVDLVKNTATFSDTKNGDSRTVPLTEAAVECLRSVDCPLWPTLSQAVLNHLWSQARLGMGLGHDAGFVPHALRHTAITRWVAAGLPLPVVAKLAGHRSIKTTLRYTHLNTQNLVDAMSRAGIL
jgi:integrase